MIKQYFGLYCITRATQGGHEGAGGGSSEVPAWLLIDVLMELFVANCRGSNRSASSFDLFLIMAIMSKAGSGVGFLLTSVSL